MVGGGRWPSRWPARGERIATAAAGEFCAVSDADGGGRRGFDKEKSLAGDGEGDWKWVEEFVREADPAPVAT